MESRCSLLPPESSLRRFSWGCLELQEQLDSADLREFSVVLMVRQGLVERPPLQSSPLFLVQELKAFGLK